MRQPLDNFIRFRHHWPGCFFPPSVCPQLGPKPPETEQGSPLVPADQKQKHSQKGKKRKETKWILLFVLTMGNYEERFYLYKQRVGEKGQLPQCSSTQAFAISTDAERGAMSRWLSACARRHGHTHTCPHVTRGFTHRAMFLRYRLCSDTSLLANPIVSNSKMVNSCSRG